MNDDISFLNLEHKAWLYVAILSSAALGIYDLFIDMPIRELTLYHLLFNLLFFLPVFFRGKVMLSIYSILSIILGAYLLIAALILLIQLSSNASSAYKMHFFLKVPILGLYTIFCGFIFLKHARIYKTHKIQSDMTSKSQ